MKRKKKQQQWKGRSRHQKRIRKSNTKKKTATKRQIWYWEHEPFYCFFFSFSIAHSFDPEMRKNTRNIKSLESLYTFSFYFFSAPSIVRFYFVRFVCVFRWVNWKFPPQNSIAYTFRVCFFFLLISLHSYYSFRSFSSHSPCLFLPFCRLKGEKFFFPNKIRTKERQFWFRYLCLLLFVFNSWEIIFFNRHTLTHIYTAYTGFLNHTKQKPSTNSSILESQWTKS